MHIQGYGKHIQNQIQAWPDNEPITTLAMAADLAGVFGIDIENAKKVTNVNIMRLAGKGKVARIQKGVYGKTKETPFGKLLPNTDDMITGLLLHDGKNISGYIAGPTLLNAIGLCSWMPKERHIAANHYRRRLPAGSPIRVYRPLAVVNDDNAAYLQAIEALISIDRYHVDAEKPDKILRRMLQENHLDNERLIWYARNLCGQKMLLKTIDIALGGIDIEAS